LTILNSRKMQVRWCHEIDVFSIASLIQIRLGIPLFGILSDMRPHIRTALAIAESLDDKEAAERGLHSRQMLRALIKIFARNGHIRALRGEIEDSIISFKRATELSRRRLAIMGKDATDAVLSGEPARRFAEALLHRAFDDKATFKEDMKAARDIVDRNIDKYEEFLAFSDTKPQNDIIPFLILKARIERKRGNSQEAQEIINSLFEHEYVRLGECTFAAQVELLLEYTELRIATNNICKQDFDKIADLIRKLEAEHHLLMAAESKLMQAKMLPSGRERIDALRVAERNFNDQGVRLWDNEIRQLRSI